MRIVLDTNVLARVVMSPRGPAAELFDRIRSDHLLITSLEMLAELSRVLDYERVRRIHQLDDQARSDFVRRIETGSLVVLLPEQVARVVPDDSDDDLVVATALTGKAEILCTRNRHLFVDAVTGYCRRRGLEIIDDVRLLAMFRHGELDTFP